MQNSACYYLDTLFYLTEIVITGILIGGALVLALFVASVLRGRKAVRAYVYIVTRGEGASELEANIVASRIDSSKAGQLNPSVMEFIRVHYAGKQLPMMSDARLDGFRE